MDDDASPIRTHAETGDRNPYAAPGEHVDPGLRYEASVTLSVEELRRSFDEDPRVAWYPNADPPAFGSPGTQEFEAWPVGPTTLVVRSNVPASIQTASPYVLLELNPLPHGGTHVQARFVRRPPGVQLGKTTRAVLAVTCIISALIVIAEFVIFPLLLFHPMLWVMAIASVAGVVALTQYSKNRPRYDSMTAFGGSLWGLVGSKLVPYAVGEGEDPFRLKALGER